MNYIYQDIAKFIIKLSLLVILFTSHSEITIAQKNGKRLEKLISRLPNLSLPYVYDLITDNERDENSIKIEYNEVYSLLNFENSRKKSAFIFSDSISDLIQFEFIGKFQCKPIGYKAVLFSLDDNCCLGVRQFYIGLFNKSGMLKDLRLITANKLSKKGGNVFNGFYIDTLFNIMVLSSVDSTPSLTTVTDFFIPANRQNSNSDMIFNNYKQSYLSLDSLVVGSIVDIPIFNKIENKIIIDENFYLISGAYFPISLIGRQNFFSLNEIKGIKVRSSKSYLLASYPIKSKKGDDRNLCIYYNDLYIDTLFNNLAEVYVREEDINGYPRNTYNISMYASLQDRNYIMTTAKIEMLNGECVRIEFDNTVKTYKIRGIGNGKSQSINMSKEKGKED